ncbi:hypothetical protein VJ918_04745 [Adlercreutzia sp. R21]|uniref:hypothetical protein n=1 Tax=Adlercreutzia wanghongyangiae TaxID=3111451 RepID=UPI002DBF57BB|nr:hypothetical protein [Adlercreutzia sp. R21]MEC4184113.1 hypothetical protein [Adlercreutzia sp. R21]
MPISSRFLSASLAALLAISPCLPCYTLAYADEGAEVIADGQLSADNRFGGRTSEVGGGQDFEGVLLNQGSEALPLSEESGCFSDFASVDSAPVSGLDSAQGQYSYSLADSLTLGGLDDVQAQANSYSFDRAGTSATNDRGQFSDDAADEGAAGGRIEDYQEGFGETETSSEADGGISQFDNDIVPYGLTELGYLDKIYFSLGGSVMGSDSMTFNFGLGKWTSVYYSMHWLLSYVLSYEYLSYYQLTYANSYLKAIDTQTKFLPSSSTVVTISDNLLKVINGLSTVANAINANAVSQNTVSTISVNLLGVKNRLDDIYDGLMGLSGIHRVLSEWAARWSSQTSTAVKQSTVETISNNILEVISGLTVVANTISANSVSQNTVSTISNNILLLSDLLASIRDNSVSQSTISTISVNLLGVKNRLDDIFLALDSDTGISRLLAVWAGRWDIQDRVMMEWGKSWELFRDGVLSSLDGGLSADMSGVESRLDDIKNLLLLAGVKDIVDTIVGDLDFAKLGVLSGEVQGAVSNAFPFCVPAVLKQVLGLVRYEGAAPVWDFDIGGESMHVDLSPMQPLADVSGWVCRIAFTVLLLASSRRFVFVGGGVQ